MATAPFAALETRANAVTIARLANAVAVYAPAVGAPKDVLVIFDDDYEEVIDGMVASAGPAAAHSLVDMPSAVRGETLCIRGILYEIVKPMPDGTGLARQRLRVKV